MITYARVNHSRWLVDCPNCNSAEVMQVGAKTFSCRECKSVYTVVWPGNVDEINAILGIRPKAENRNWSPGETVEMLRLENVVHGIEEL